MQIPKDVTRMNPSTEWLSTMSHDKAGRFVSYSDYQALMRVARDYESKLQRSSQLVTDTTTKLNDANAVIQKGLGTRLAGYVYAENGRTRFYDLGDTIVKGLPVTPVYYIESKSPNLTKCGPSVSELLEGIIEPVSDCNCETCSPITMMNMRMIVCPVCGNKRCPKARHHLNDCTGSNDVGQVGSYTGA